MNSAHKKTMKIGEVARAAGLGVDAIRFYERNAVSLFSRADLLPTFFLCSASMLFMMSGAANASIMSAELRVNGMTCPFCAFGIEKKLLKVDGVDEVEVFLEEGRLVLTFEEENQARVMDIKRAVNKAGFKLVSLRLRARGKLIGSREAGLELLAHSELRFRIVEGRGDDGAARSSLGFEEARRSIADADWVEVGGLVEGLDESLPSLVVEADGTPQ